MNVLLVGAVLILALTSFVESSDADNESKEKRWFWFCRRHSNCTQDKYCRKMGYFGRCQTLPRCLKGTSCPAELSCSKETGYCLKQKLRYCLLKSSICDRATECCKPFIRRLSIGTCQKRPSAGDRCRVQTLDPCRRCAAGYYCRTTWFSAKCRPINPTTQPTTITGS